MSRIIRSAKSGSSWTYNELEAYHIEIRNQPAKIFFGQDFPATLTHIDPKFLTAKVPTDAASHDTQRLLPTYLDLATKANAGASLVEMFFLVDAHIGQDRYDDENESLHEEISELEQDRQLGLSPTARPAIYYKLKCFQVSQITIRQWSFPQLPDIFPSNTACIYIAHKFCFVLPTETGRNLIYLFRTKRNITPRILPFLSTQGSVLMTLALCAYPFPGGSSLWRPMVGRLEY